MQVCLKPLRFLSNYVSMVWVPILSVDKIAALWTLQQIPDLLKADAEDSVKLEEAEKVIDTLSQQMLVKSEQAATRAKMHLT